MSEIIVSSSSNSDDREIDEYHDSSFSGSSFDSSISGSSSSGGNTIDEEYTSRVPGIPLYILQQKMRMRMAFDSLAGTSTNVPLSHSSEEETLYSHAVDIPLKTDEKKLASLRSWY